MEQIKPSNILDILPRSEADIVQYFGKIRNGKTYIATADILDLLNQGQVVYANWRVKWNGRDTRNELWAKILGTLGLKKTFLVFPKENFHYLPVDAKFFETFAKLTDCYVFLDEGHVAFNSYEMTRMDIGKQASILHTGHFDRAIRIISQRATNIHVQMRANVNVFYKCEKLWQFGKLIRFRKTAYEEMNGDETVDLEQPLFEQKYWGKQRVFEAYDTKYLRGNTPASQTNATQIWHIGWREWITKFWLKKTVAKFTPVGIAKEFSKPNSVPLAGDSSRPTNLVSALKNGQSQVSLKNTQSPSSTPKTETKPKVL